MDNNYLKSINYLCPHIDTKNNLIMRKLLRLKEVFILMKIDKMILSIKNSYKYGDTIDPIINIYIEELFSFNVNPIDKTTYNVKKVNQKFLENQQFNLQTNSNKILELKDDNSSNNSLNRIKLDTNEIYQFNFSKTLNLKNFFITNELNNNHYFKTLRIEILNDILNYKDISKKVTIGKLNIPLIEIFYLCNFKESVEEFEFENEFDILGEDYITKVGVLSLLFKIRMNDNNFDYLECKSSKDNIKSKIKLIYKKNKDYLNKKKETIICNNNYKNNIKIELNNKYNFINNYYVRVSNILPNIVESYFYIYNKNFDKENNNIYIDYKNKQKLLLENFRFLNKLNKYNKCIFYKSISNDNEFNIKSLIEEFVKAIESHNFILIYNILKFVLELYNKEKEIDTLNLFVSNLINYETSPFLKTYLSNKFKYFKINTFNFSNYLLGLYFIICNNPYILKLYFLILTIFVKQFNQNIIKEKLNLFFNNNFENSLLKIVLYNIKFTSIFIKKNNYNKQSAFINNDFKKESLIQINISLNIIINLVNFNCLFDFLRNNNNIKNKHCELNFDYRFLISKVYLICIDIINIRYSLLIVIEVALNDSFIISIIINIFKKAIYFISLIVSTNFDKVIDFNILSEDIYKKTLYNLKDKLIYDKDSKFLHCMNIIKNYYSYYPEIQININLIIIYISNIINVSINNKLNSINKYNINELPCYNYILITKIKFLKSLEYLTVFTSHNNHRLISLTFLKVLKNIISNISQSETYCFKTKLLIIKYVNKYLSINKDVVINCNNINNNSKNLSEDLKIIKLDFQRYKYLNIEIQEFISFIGYYLTDNIFKYNKDIDFINKIINSILIMDIINYLSIITLGYSTKNKSIKFNRINNSDFIENYLYLKNIKMNSTTKNIVENIIKYSLGVIFNILNLKLSFIYKSLSNMLKEKKIDNWNLYFELLDIFILKHNLSSSSFNEFIERIKLLSIDCK